MLPAMQKAFRPSAGSSAAAGSWSACRRRHDRREEEPALFWGLHSRVDGVGRLGLLAKDEFLDFTRRSLRQLTEHHRARRLELRHVLPAELDQLLLGHF